MLAFVWAVMLVTVAPVNAGGYRDKRGMIDLNEAADISDEERPLLAGWQDHPTEDGWTGHEQDIHLNSDALPDTSNFLHYATKDAADIYHATYGSNDQGVRYPSTSHQTQQHQHRGESSRQDDEDQLYIGRDRETNTAAKEAQLQPVAARLILPERLSMARQAYLRTGQKGGFVFFEAPMTPLQVQQLFDSEWDRRQLGYDVPARKLAESVSEIKLEMGYDAQIGHAASMRVRKDAAGGHLDYLRDFTTWQNRFTRKIITLRKRYAADATFKNDEERAMAVYVHFRHIVEKTYDGKRKLQDVCSQKAMQKLDNKMRAVWKAFMGERIRPALGQNVDESTLPLELIEYYSRDFQWKEQKRQATTECIKRYMMQILKRDPRDNLRFTALRTEWRQELHSGSRQKNGKEGEEEGKNEE